MLLSLAAALLAFQTTSADTTPVSLPTAAQAADAYLDANAGDLVQRARARRETTAREIQEYRVVARERISLGLRALGRERLFFRREIAARIHWQRGGAAQIEVLGARQVLPAFSSKVQFADGVETELAGLVFDPADERLFDDLFPSGEDRWLRHPLAAGSEADYRFRSGDTTTLRLHNGSTVRLLELQVLARRRDSQLVQGSIWLDAESNAPVRAVLRLARPFDLELDAGRKNPDDPDDDDDVPTLLKPIRADVRFITIEYALWDGRWWLPRLMAVDAVAEVNTLPDFPVRFERAYSGYDVVGTSATGVELAASGNMPITECPKRKRKAEFRITNDGATAEIRSDVDGDSTAAAESGTGPGVTCTCSRGRCQFYTVQMPADTAAMLASEYLPASAFASSETLVTGEQVSQLTDQLKKLAPPSWGFHAPTVRWVVGRPDLLRYNRVEGLSAGGRVTVDFGPVAADATARIGIADWEPEVEIGMLRDALSSRLRTAAYRRLAAVDPATRPFGLGNSLSGLLFGQDDGDYFRALGVELTGRPAGAAPQWYDWRLFAERQTAAEKNTDFSVPHLFDDERDFRPVIPAARADQVGGAVTLRTARGLNPAGFRWAAELGMEASAGSFDFVRPSASAFGSAPLSRALVGSLEIAAGTSAGTVPVQSQWFLGGPRTLRGYAPASAIGDSFWRGRAEVATAAPGARIAVFSDAGWAGPRDHYSLSADLLSAGVGTSFLDGLIRLDVARALRGDTGWRAELYLGTAL
jgi:hypothetical protein